MYQAMAGTYLSVALICCIVAHVAYAQSSSSSSSSSTTITSTIRLRANRLRRPESCREALPRRADELPALVAVARVKEVYLVSDAPPSVVAAQQQAAATLELPAEVTSLLQPPRVNHALVQVGRVIKGNQQLVGSDIIISGFNSSSAQPCPNYVKPNDTYILLLQPTSDGDGRKFALFNNNLLSMNLNNLDKINAIASDEPYKRRGNIEDILCEAHYCAYGRCVANESTRQVSCECPTTCPSSGLVGGSIVGAVCGSDNNTYTSECHLIREGCRIKRPLFVTKEAAC